MKVIKPLPVTSGTFARASTATYVSSAGVLQSAAVDVPRVGFDPSTGICQGIMVEPAATNLKTYSSDFTNASWSKQGTTVTANTATAPDGTTTMDLLKEDTSYGTHTLGYTSISLTVGQPITMSIFIKAGPGSRTLYLFPGYNPAYFSSGAGAGFDPATGVLSPWSADVTASSVVSFGNGVYRVSITATALATASVSLPTLFLINPVAEDSQNYTGDGTSGVYLWGAQYEQGTLSSYIPTTTTTVTRAADVTTGTLVYSNLVDVDAQYSAGTTYTLNQRVTYNQQIWECILSPSTGNTPTDYPLYWVSRGPSNRWAAFDSQVSTASTSNLEQIYVLRPGPCSGLGLFGLSGYSLEVSVLSEPGGPLLSSKKILLDGADISNWYQYYFSPVEQQTEYVVTDLSLYSLSYITVRVVGPSTVACGHLSLGEVVDLGGSQYGASIGITDYSLKKTDANGVSTFYEKGYSKDLTVDTLFDKSQLGSVYRTLASLRATPCTWVVADSEEYSTLTTFGNIRNFSINVEYYSTSLCNFDIQGLTA